MSIPHIKAVFETSKSKGVARLVMLSIADRADDDGKMWCGIQDLCARVNASRAQVFAAIKTLQELGELTVFPYKGKNHCNAYQVGNCLVSGQSEIQTVQKSDSNSLESRLQQSGNQTQTHRNHKRTNSDGDFVSQLKAQSDFLTLDVDQEAIKARRWISRHKGRRFTKLFLTKWLERALTSKPTTKRPAGGVMIESGYKGPVRL